MIFELIIGIIMLASALYTYIPQPEFMHELTFLSNMAGGLLFLSGYVMRKVKQKELPHILYLTETVTISTVFLITVGGTVTGLANFNFSGGMFFLHAINPVLVVLYYVFFLGKRKYRFAYSALSPTFLMLYLLFDYIRFLITHELVYNLFPADELTILTVVIIGLLSYVFAAALGTAIWGMGRGVSIIRNNRNKSKNMKG